jgi:hypothetical protein
MTKKTFLHRTFVITLIFAIVISFFFTCWFFKYPDVIITPIVISKEYASHENVNEITPENNYGEGGHIIIGRFVVSKNVHIAPWQIVQIRLDRYSPEEYGIVTGIIKSVEKATGENAIEVTVDLPNGLATNYGKEVPINLILKGSAEIMTEDKRLLDRIFDR